MAKMKDAAILLEETGIDMIGPRTNMDSWEYNPNSLFSEGEYAKYLGRRKLPTDEE